MVAVPTARFLPRFLLTTPTHPRLRTTLSSAGCRRLVHFIDYLTDYLLGPDLDRHLLRCYATRHFPLCGRLAAQGARCGRGWNSTSCAKGQLRIVPCTMDLCMAGRVIVLPLPHAAGGKGPNRCSREQAAEPGPPEKESPKVRGDKRQRQREPRPRETADSAKNRNFWGRPSLRRRDRTKQQGPNSPADRLS